MKTKSGRTLSEEDVGRVVSRAVEGFDLSTWAPRRGRPSLDAATREPSPRIAVRLPQALHRRVATRAAGEGRTVSQVVRGLLADYAAASNLPDVDRSEIRRAIRMTDVEREAYFLASNRNMLQLFADGRRTE